MDDFLSIQSLLFFSVVWRKQLLSQAKAKFSYNLEKRFALAIVAEEYSNPKGILRLYA